MIRSHQRVTLLRMMHETATHPQTEPAVARWIQTPLGRMVAIAGDREIVRLGFVDEGESDRFIERHRPGLYFVGSHPLLDTLVRELAEYFAGARAEFSVPVSPRGTEFDRRAWAYLKTIPFGQTRTYGQQARAIAGSNAARAVGRANGANPIAILVPCHRVIGADGSLTGFAAGMHRKRWLLDHEQRFGPGGGVSLFNL